MAEARSLGPLVSIGVPSYQRAAFLEQSVRSALGQTHSQIEVIVSDNASTDGSVELLQKLAAADSRLRLIAQTENRGPTQNFLAVLRESRGDFFMWLGDDDWIDPDYVEKCLRALRDEASVVVAGGRAVYYRNEQSAFDGAPTQVTGESPLSRMLSYLRRVGDNGIFYGMIRRECIDLSQIKNSMAWDWILFLHLAYQGKIVTRPDTRVHRRLGGATQSYSKIAAVMGLSGWSARFPFSAFYSSWLGELWLGSAYRQLTVFSRLGYSIGVLAVLFRYKTLPAIKARLFNKESLA